MSFSKFAGRVYLAWGGFWFVGTFLMLYPFFMLFVWVKPLQMLTVPLNKIWSLVFFPFSFIRVTVTRKFRPTWSGTYVYCANHTSYLDIPLLTYLLPGFICFMGKASLAKVPLFGVMFRGLHITVDRRSRQDRYRSMKDGLQKLEAGRPVIVFPEGHTNTQAQPSLLPFKDGAFRMAIEKQVPIVPLTIPYNGIILPDDGSLIARFHRAHLVIHEPIETKGLTENDIERLKEQVYSVILAELTLQAVKA